MLCHWLALSQEGFSIKRVRATRGYATPATRGTSPRPPWRLPWPVFSKNRWSRFLFQTFFEKQEQTPDGYQVGSQDS
jgi:hypothetical protein